MHVILGGTRGLGWEFAQQLRSAGHMVFVLGRSYDPALHGEGCVGDLHSESSAQDAVSKLNDIEIESFYWSTGVIYKGDFSAQKDPHQMVNVNLSNPLLLVQYAWNQMLKRNAGRMVIISSTTGVKARTNEAVYALTKHAQVGFARSLGLEAERLKSRVKVQLVIPGGMRTGFWDEYAMDPEIYSTYNEPNKVAAKILSSQTEETFSEIVIDRGSV